jgi:thiol-disulfide isomerase/thioredoxin
MRALSFVVLIAAFLFAATDSGAQPPAKDKDPKPKTNAKTDPKGKADPKDGDEPEGKLKMDMKVKDITLGSHVSGPKVAKGDLTDRVILVDKWGINCAPCLAAMPATATLNAELADFGLLILGSQVQGGEVDEVRAKAARHGANFPILQGGNVRGSDDAGGIPHALLFDHKGDCLYRGHPTKAEPLIRKAVGEALVAGAKREKFSPPLEPIVKELKAGKPPAGLLARVAGLRTTKGQVGEDATALLDSMTAVGQKKLKEAEGLAGSSPGEAYLLVEKVPTTYKGTPLATKATELITKLKKEKVVMAEINARSALEGVKKIDQQLGGTKGQDPKKVEYQKANALTLKQLKTKVQAMKTNYPDAQATKEATEIADKYGVELK